MPFDWREYLVLAKELGTDGRESTGRASISRAYYCTYHLGRIFAISSGYSEPAQSAHYALWNWYESQPNVQLRALGVQGNRLKKLRVKADYRADLIPRLSNVVQDSLRDAEEFKNKLRGIGGHLFPPQDGGPQE